jgi:FdhD protein
MEAGLRPGIALELLILSKISSPGTGSLTMKNRVLEKVEYTELNGGRVVFAENIIKETSLTIRVDNKHIATAMIMATMEKEFVIGHLFGQGIIGSAADIESLKIKENETDVTLRANMRIPEKKSTVNSDLIIRKEDVFDCVRAILKSEIFDETEAVHSAGLFRNGSETVCIAEDLGRHNALDKVIGYGLLNSINFGDMLAASTGRQPTEMILKCINAGIPIIATKGVPTNQAIGLANTAGITIAGLVRGDTMIVYSTPARII